MPIGAVTQPPEPQQQALGSEAVAEEASELKQPAPHKSTSGEGKKEKPSGLYPVSLDDTAKKQATLLLRQAVTDRAAGLWDLIWHLLYEDKLTLAFHLAACQEVEYPDF